MLIPHNRQLIRLALALHDRLHSHEAATFVAKMPESIWQQCGRLHRRMQLARQRDWHLAAQRLQRELQQAFARLQGDLQALCNSLESSEETNHTASIHDIYEDLIALHEEFDGLSFDRRGQTLSVTTESINLEGITLGPFEICLDWGDLIGGHPNNYRVIAIDAHPAATNDSVTHPHVQDEAVCEGEGRQPIRRAQEQGRLLDFFMIVANLLRTYNSGSPYVSLADWHGVECADCGTTMHGGDRWTCERCDATTCGDCYYSCSNCDGIYCGECSTSCEECGERQCKSCIDVCSGCIGEFCRDCLQENERCSECHDKANEIAESNSSPECDHPLA